jgi:hypothetical protein
MPALEKEVFGIGLQQRVTGVHNVRHRRVVDEIEVQANVETEIAREFVPGKAVANDIADPRYMNAAVDHKVSDSSERHEEDGTATAGAWVESL